ncbi:MAG: hypothetical protein K0Q43_1216 [Ramlibacter sp.]|jgi:hypothetical protein|nr:hypothetical protein [Ramlibacter sp.]MDF2462981.1 hypothetical protein [Ramlibacter sp.]
MNLTFVIPASFPVIPAKAGTQGFRSPNAEALDSRLRGNDEGGRGNDA